ncbi:regulatory iron-sulfur-containing complex subunit RicT [uncultured Hymenobacter sp.]|uniref:regulatory iron-sulfur-containing complex subunit RicT n=1 Tax=uncultured Hymenobacter sp. TaxID=170016 RepID=UPI0035C9F67C
MACSTCSTGGGCSTSSSTGGKVGGCGSKGGCSSGCTRLNVFDWLQDVELPDNFQGFDIAEIRFKGGRKEFFRNDKRLPLVTGDAVVVEAAGAGWHLGHVSLKGELVRLQMRKKKVATDSKDIRSILRVATPEDEERWQAVRDLENGTMFRARAVVSELRLRMKLSDVEYQADRTKALFFYSAEDRVDFRDLIRRLADEFRVRVEMRQISLRQEAGRIGGIGVCGRELCCSTWLQDFKTVSTTAARYQNLSLNPQKLAGQCGRLKCCLNYELDAYMDALKDIPSVQRPLQTERGEAFLQKTDIFRRRMWFAFKGDNNWVMLSTERVRELLEMNKRGEKIDNLLAPRPEAEILPEVTAMVEDSLDRLDDKIKSGKRSKRKKKDGRDGAGRPEGAAADGRPTPPARRNPRDTDGRPRQPHPDAGPAANPGAAPSPAPGFPHEAFAAPDAVATPGLTPPADARPGLPTEAESAEQRGRRGAAARPLNRRGGRNRGSGAAEAGTATPDAPRPDGEIPTPRRPNEGRPAEGNRPDRPERLARPEGSRRADGNFNRPGADAPRATRPANPDGAPGARPEGSSAEPRSRRDGNEPRRESREGREPRGENRSEPRNENRGGRNRRGPRPDGSGSAGSPAPSTPPPGPAGA